MEPPFFMSALPPISIKQAAVSDIPVIRDLAHRIWPDAYLEIIGQAQIDYMLNLMYSPASLEKQMNEGAQFLLALEADEPVGFASYGEMEPGIVKLHKLYVLPSQQGKGTGRQLVDHIITTIKGATALQLQVNRNNKARHFYEKNGFTIVNEIRLDIGNGFFMNDYIMEKRLG
jgi:diamine N-acetyltransferase